MLFSKFLTGTGSESITTTLLLILILTTFPISPVQSYTPAHPTNSTQDAVAAGLNLTDTSTFFAKWSEDVNGSYGQHIAYQWAAEGSRGVSEGVLLHMSEDLVDEDTPPTKTPWIALISCDANATAASPTKDIFALAREKGAVATIIYSSFSDFCVLHPPPSPGLEPPLDIYASQTRTSSFLLASYLFAAHIAPFPPAPSSFGSSASAVLNASARVVGAAIARNTYPPKGHLLARVRVWNVTDESEATTTGDFSSASTGVTAATVSDRLKSVLVWLGIETGMPLIATVICVSLMTIALYSFRS